MPFKANRVSVNLRGLLVIRLVSVSFLALVVGFHMGDFTMMAPSKFVLLVVNLTRAAVMAVMGNDGPT